MKPLMASKVLVESDLEDDQDALLPVEGARVRRRGVRNSSGVDKVGGCAVAFTEKDLLGL